MKPSGSQSIKEGYYQFFSHSNILSMCILLEAEEISHWREALAQPYPFEQTKEITIFKGFYKVGYSNHKSDLAMGRYDVGCDEV